MHYIKLCSQNDLLKWH